MSDTRNSDWFMTQPFLQLGSSVGKACFWHTLLRPVHVILCVCWLCCECWVGPDNLQRNHPTQIILCVCSVCSFGITKDKTKVWSTSFYLDGVTDVERSRIGVVLCQATPHSGVYLTMCLTPSSHRIWPQGKSMHKKEIRSSFRLERNCALQPPQQ